MGILDGPNNKILKPDSRVQEALEALADHVDHYKPGMGPGIKTVKVDGVVFGYRLEDHKVFMRRMVFMKVPGWHIEDLSEDERATIQVALMQVFFLPGGKMPTITPLPRGVEKPDCLLFTQDFVPEIAVELKPGLVTLSGGWEKPN